MKDQYGRTIDYMRISVTDRCNLRCQFCMPDKKVCFMEEAELLSYSEYLEIVKAAVTLGIHKFRITGGEPLVRAGILSFIKELKQTDGVNEVYLTTNGVLLEEKIRELKEAKIDGINVSLCSTDEAEYEVITGFPMLKKVIRGIKAAVNEGIHVKLNSVPLTNMNEDHLIDLALLAKDNPIEVRFIEMMPIGRGTLFDLISSEKVLAELEEVFGPSTRTYDVAGNGPAVYSRFEGFKGSIGFISARTCAFCGTCNRVRLSADGYLKLCLNYEDGVDLKKVIRNGGSDKELSDVMEQAIFHKPAHHSFNQSTRKNQKYRLNTKYMAQIGG